LNSGNVAMSRRLVVNVFNLSTVETKHGADWLEFFLRENKDCQYLVLIWVGPQDAVGLWSLKMWATFFKIDGFLPVQRATRSLRNFEPTVSPLFKASN
jgi:hypothetical protein